MTKINAVYSSSEPRTKVVFPGRVQFIRDYDEFWDYLHQGDEYYKGTAYQSRVYVHPTYEEAFAAFKQSVQCTGNANHVFFEGVYHVRTVNGVAIYKFFAGS